MDDIVERLRERPSRHAAETEDQAKERRQREREEAADTITTLNERNAEYIGTIDRLRRRVAETDVEIERLRDVMQTAIRQFEDGNRLSCHRTLCDEVYGKQK